MLIIQLITTLLYQEDTSKDASSFYDILLFMFIVPLSACVRRYIKKKLNGSCKISGTRHFLGAIKKMY